MPPALHRNWPNIIAWLVIAAISVWLFACVPWVNIDFDDGYSTIVNAQYLLGASPEYAWQRGPLLAVWLMPAEALANHLGLPPFDVRLHHVLMAIAHALYLVICWLLLKQIHGNRWTVLAAFVLSIPSVLFFSYAPFVSHDIFPGVMALLMLKLAVDFHQRPTAWRWLSLVALGAGAALVKQTFALFWVWLLLSFLAVAAIAGSDRPGLLRTWLRLAAAAAVSGAIAWLGYASVLGSAFPDAPFLLRPVQQIGYISTQYETEGNIALVMDPWIYWRNIPAYGLAAVLLLLPGLLLCWRDGSGLLRLAAVFWLLGVTVMSLVPFKEVRYLAFLAPVTAVLIVPAIAELRRWPAVLVLLGLVFALFDVRAGVSEALRLRDGYYAHAVMDFMRWLPSARDPSARVVTTKPLSFVSPEGHGFRNDRYHRITHISDFHIRNLVGYPADSIRNVPLPRDLNKINFRENDYVVFANDVALRAGPFRADNAVTLQDYFVEFIARVELLELRRSGTSYELTPPSPEPVMLLPISTVSADPLTSFSTFSADAVAGLLDLPRPLPPQLQVHGLRIKRLCSKQGCQEFAPR